MAAKDKVPGIPRDGFHVVIDLELPPQTNLLSFRAYIPPRRVGRDAFSWPTAAIFKDPFRLLLRGEVRRADASARAQKYSSSAIRLMCRFRMISSIVNRVRLKLHRWFRVGNPAIGGERAIFAHGFNALFSNSRESELSAWQDDRVPANRPLKKSLHAASRSRRRSTFALFFSPPLLNVSEPLFHPAVNIVSRGNHAAYPAAAMRCLAASLCR